MFHQYAALCDEHPSCRVISCVTDADVADPISGAVHHRAGAEVWSSHLDAAIHVEHRINPDVAATDTGSGRAVTYEPVCATCAAHPAWPA